MGFKEAVMTCLKEKYASFEGRAGRSEFWYFWLFSWVATVVAAIVVSCICGFFGGTSGVFIGYSIGAVLVALALLCPGLAVAVRRLHDIGKSGWWLLLGLIPYIGGIVLFIFYLLDSKDNNRYGPSPKNI